MKLVFSEHDKEKKLHELYLEEDDVRMECTHIEKEAEHYALWGTAEIEGECFKDFKVIFALEEETEETIEAIMTASWEWYDFDFLYE